MDGIQLSLFGKTCPEPSLQTRERTSDASSKSLLESAGTAQYLDLTKANGNQPERSWATDTASRGGNSTRNTGECPSVARESTLWQILQADAPEKYYLSARACKGILRRAERRGKALPPMLLEALEEAVALNAGNVKSAQQPNCVCYPQVARTLTAEADASPCIDRSQNVVCYDARGNGDGAHCQTLTGDHENRVTDYTAVTVYRSPKIGEYAADGTASTMAARDFKSPRDLVVEHTPVYGMDCRNAVLDEEKTHTLQAKANGEQSLNCTPSVLMDGRPPRKYIIRRLTPLECCRLQGFPDGWGVPDHKDRLSEEELAFWQGVRDTCSLIAGKPSKKYSAETLTKWYNALHTDSAEYKMWGNGIALPCAAFVLGGVAETLMEEKQK